MEKEPTLGETPPCWELGLKAHTNTSVTSAATFRHVLPLLQGQLDLIFMRVKRIASYHFIIKAYFTPVSLNLSIDRFNVLRKKKDNILTGKSDAFLMI